VQVALSGDADTAAQGSRLAPAWSAASALPIRPRRSA
jgi:hypothetical protein